MANVGIGILALAVIGVWCGILNILDAFGVIDLDHLDDPEMKHYKTTEYSKKGEINGSNEE